MDDKIVTLSIGGGGRQTSNFIKDIILKYFDNEILSNLGDASHVETSTNTALQQILLLSALNFLMEVILASFLYAAQLMTYL